MSTPLQLSLVLVVASALACAHHPADFSGTPEAKRPSLSTQHGSAPERATVAQLTRLFERYDLSPWLYTRTLLVDEDALPHSHPTLTLHTRHLRDDALLLATYVHEQSHWYLTQHESQTTAAVAELQSMAPGLPVGFPDGADSLESSYEHLLVITLEERGVRRLLGELAAKEVMEFWASDHYRALYRYVIEHRAAVVDVMKRHGL